MFSKWSKPWTGDRDCELVNGTEQFSHNETYGDK